MKWTIVLLLVLLVDFVDFFCYTLPSLYGILLTVHSSLLQDLERKQQELDGLTTRIQNLEDVSTFPKIK